MLLLMYMKNNIVKTVIAMISLAGYGCIFSGVTQMSASVTVTFVFCWTAFVLGILFAFSPEIKRLVFKKDRLELERYKQQVDKALVEYDEFKKTIYPLLELSLSSIVSRHYFGGGPKSEEYDKLIQNSEKIIEHNNFDNLKPLLLASKAFLLNSIAAELSTIEQTELGTDNSKNYINDGFQEYSDSRYVNPDEVYVNIDRLKEVKDSLPNNANKKKYASRLKLLEKVYKENFE